MGWVASTRPNKGVWAGIVEGGGTHKALACAVVMNGIFSINDLIQLLGKKKSKKNPYLPLIKVSLRGDSKDLRPSVPT